MYVLVKDDAVVENPYSVSQLRTANPQVSFPATPTDALLAEFCVFPCVETEKPQITHLQNIAKSFSQIGGVWTQDWVISDASPEEIAQRLANQWASVRSERNERLAACDWTQLADAPVDDLAWAVYRQALRDITTQTDPFNIVWPISP